MPDTCLGVREAECIRLKTGWANRPRGFESRPRRLSGTTTNKELSLLKRIVRYTHTANGSRTYRFSCFKTNGEKTVSPASGYQGPENSDSPCARIE